MAEIDEVVKSFLIDPAWQKVFKHSFDVFEDYIAYILISVGAISLSVRLLTTLGTGDLVCIIIGVENGTDPADIKPYASGGTLGMLSYAQTEQACISAVYTKFMEYLPYIMLLQTLILVICEKFTFKIPRITQKVERFYKNIVEESLFGKDPDVAEDMTDPKNSTEAISRRRQRNEICVSLKRSSIIHHVYIAKNFMEIFIVCVFLPVNISYALVMKETSAPCDINVMAFPGLVEEEGVIHFQCRGKKKQFYILALWVQIVLLALHACMSVGCIIWSWKFRAVTNLINTIEALRKAWEEPVIKQHDGKDFLFLFDLLAHSCGLEATLRVLTHSDDNFYTICRPNFKVENGLNLEEDKLKIVFRPADIERWLYEGNPHGRSQRSISIDSYQVTMFPAESVKNTQTIPIVRSDDSTIARNGDVTYSTWFYDLQGGRIEYVITIACMIGKSRMKGEKVVTNLVPYGPDKPRTGMVKQAGTHQVEIFWDAPKGEFTKYVMTIEKIPDKPAMSSTSMLDGGEKSQEPKVDFDAFESKKEIDNRAIRQVENLSYKLTSYTILGLDPGEKYRIELGTKTGNVATRQTITEVIMTRPLPVGGLMANEVTSSSCVLHWLIPKNHSCIKGFQIVVKLAEGKVVKNVAVNKHRSNFFLTGLSPGHDYTIALTTLCVYQKIRTESEEAEVGISTVPESVKNLRLENATHNSLLIKWELLLPVGAQNVRQRLILEGVGVEYSTTVDLPGDKNMYNFTKLPEPEGSGRQFKLSVFVNLLTGSEHDVKSATVVETFATLPLKPTNLRKGSGDMDIVWNRSPTTHVSGYNIRWRSGDDDFGEDCLPANPGRAARASESEPSYTFRGLQPDVVYKISVAAVVKFNEEESVESKDLFGKFIWKENIGLVPADD